MFLCSLAAYSDRFRNKNPSLQTVPKAKEFYDRKIEFLKQNIEQVQALAMQKMRQKNGVFRLCPDPLS